MCVQAPACRAACRQRGQPQRRATRSAPAPRAPAAQRRARQRRAARRAPGGAAAAARALGGYDFGEQEALAALLTGPTNPEALRSQESALMQYLNDCLAAEAGPGGLTKLTSGARPGGGGARGGPRGCRRRARARAVRRRRGGRLGWQGWLRRPGPVGMQAAGAAAARAAARP